MATITMLGMLLTGTHAARPAANTVGTGSLYACSTHSLIYQSDGSSWATWANVAGSGLTDPMTTRGDIIVRNASNVTARLGIGSSGKVLQSDGTDIAWTTPSAGGQEFNEGAAAALTNATSTGDAGGRADGFPGTSLSGSWTREATALSTGPTVKYSSFGGVAGSACHYVQTYTPSGAFRIECRIWMQSSTNSGGMGLIARDSGSGDASGNAMVAEYTWISGNASTLRLLSMDTGAYTARQTINVDAFNVAGGNVVPGWLYLYLSRDGSNVWTCGYSRDRTSFLSTGTHSKTITIAKAGLRLDSGTFGVDFFDVVT
jgi:hypothetical protein